MASDTDVILFNIDSKADTKSGRDAILAVFLKVLNEMQGYCRDHPHIAHLERYLDSQGKLKLSRRHTGCHRHGMDRRNETPTNSTAIR